MERFKIDILKEKLDQKLEKDSLDKRVILSISQDLDKLIVKYTKNYINGLNQELPDKNNSHITFGEQESIKLEIIDFL